MSQDLHFFHVTSDQVAIHKSKALHACDALAAIKQVDNAAASRCCELLNNCESIYHLDRFQSLSFVGSCLLPRVESKAYKQKLSAPKAMGFALLTQFWDAKTEILIKEGGSSCDGVFAHALQAINNSPNRSTWASFAFATLSKSIIKVAEHDASKAAGMIKAAYSYVSEYDFETPKRLDQFNQKLGCDLPKQPPALVVRNWEKPTP